MAEMFENADFLGQAQRRVERQEVHERAKAHAFRHPRYRAEIHARHWHEIERRGMVLGDVQAKDSSCVGRRGKFQAFVKRGRDRPIRALDVIEKSNLHDIALRPV